MDDIKTPWSSDEADEKELEDLLQKKKDLLSQLNQVEQDIQALLNLLSIKNS